MSFPALALGLCALTCLQHDALGQAQMGAAETCFDDGPDKLPATLKASIPSLRAEMPTQIAQFLQPAHRQLAKSAATRPAHAPSPDSHARSRIALKKKAPEGTLTAAR